MDMQQGALDLSALQRARQPELTQARWEQLRTQLGEDPTEAVVEQFTCGPYEFDVAVVHESLKTPEAQFVNGQLAGGFSLQRFKLFVFAGETPVGSLQAYLSFVAHLRSRTALQRMRTMLPRTLDVVEAWSILNPYYPRMLAAADAETQQLLQEKFMARLQAFEPVQNTPILFIDRLEVESAHRRRGVCRTLLHILAIMLGDYSAWLDLGTAPENREIAEHLGFQHTESPAAYRLSDCLLEIMNQAAKS